MTDDCTQKTVFPVSRPRVSLPNSHFLLFFVHCFQRKIKNTKTTRLSLIFFSSICTHICFLSPSKFAWISTEFISQAHSFFFYPDRRTIPFSQSASVIDPNLPTVEERSRVPPAESTAVSSAFLPFRYRI